MFRGEKIIFSDKKGYNLKTKNYISYKPPGLEVRKIDDGLIYGTSEDILEFEMENDPSRKTKTAESVTELDICELRSLAIFELVGLSGIGKVRKVNDADTLELVIFIPLSHFQLSKGEGGFYTCVTCRLNGIDFAESKTEEGKEATELMKELYAKHNNVVYFDIVRGKYKHEKYGRQLIELYSPDKSEFYNTKYLDKIAKTGRPMAKLYDGGTKDEELKSLPRVLKCVK